MTIASMKNAPGGITMMVHWCHQSVAGRQDVAEEGAEAHDFADDGDGDQDRV